MGTGNDREPDNTDSKKLRFDTSVAHQARIYDYWLGGKDNFAADRAAGDKALEVQPNLYKSVRANRAFLVRVVRYLADEIGIRQFLDIGTGIPTANNTHEVAQDIAPDSRIVYVDNDPVVLLHAQALLTSKPAGACAYVDADFRQPEKILAKAADLLDFSRPTALMLLGILQLIPDSDEPYKVVARLLDELCPGSYLAISHPAGDMDPRAVKAAAILDTMSAEKRTMRGHDQVKLFFAGTDLLPPGLVPVNKWRPESELQASGTMARWAGLGHKPRGALPPGAPITTPVLYGYSGYVPELSRYAPSGGYKTSVTLHA
jgi:trans-aconitate methyltransferase